MKSQHNKDPHSTNEEMSESKAEMMREQQDPSLEAKEPPSEHELDMHHDTLMKAEDIKSDKHIMKHLVPHMQKKMASMKSLHKSVGVVPVGEKITSIEGLRAKAKSL